MGERGDVERVFQQLDRVWAVARSDIRSHLNSIQVGAMGNATGGPGTVCLVGAGPGDPGLITVKGLRCLETADVVVHDRLVDERLLARVAGHATIVDVGKARGKTRKTQEEINELLIAEAAAGRSVVRLKGGDPFIFGRGGEEAEALAEAGIPFEVVPGVTSAVAAPAYAGIPLTHRDIASTVTLVTGSESPSRDDDTPWAALAGRQGTLVVLMGWDALESIATTLVRAGRPGETPVALVQWGTAPHQRTVVGALSDIVEKAGDAGLAPPVVIVIGDVVRLREKARWYDNRPLFGKRVLVTRSRSQAGSLSELLSREGAQPVEVPTVEIQPLQASEELDSALKKLAEFDWVVFPSANAVEAVFGRLSVARKDSRAFHGARVAAIGSATADALRGRGIDADFVPQEFVSESVVDGMKPMGIAGAKVLLPKADIGREALARGLQALGATVHEVTAYRTVMPADAGPVLARSLAQGIDAATFTSTSTVKNLVRILHGDLNSLAGAVIACIGPVTAGAAAEAGLNADIVASEHTVAGLVGALRDHYSQGRSDDE